MKIRSFFVNGLLVLIMYTNCSKDKRPVSNLNETERKLVGYWSTKQITVEHTGQPTVVMNNFSDCYHIIFKDQPYPNLNTGIYADTKWSEDWKDCSKAANAWKVGSDGKLLLASNDTVYADILILEEDTLAFRFNSNWIPGDVLTFEFR
ncbi:hypothetical protein [Chitinophaga filiformis]|uniref:Lipocalin-like domain-containing protein n=1 Tax=Chitinophaga filiformis TaxID=104663 RepID=A0ABY4I1L9_CHIFI|nr:hypothetical protein [Chitinophaga filiformis]UPK69508.1 hypothetical protein MYF79_31590 [Chitinophaga filiformis]